MLTGLHLAKLRCCVLFGTQLDRTRVMATLEALLVLGMHQAGNMGIAIASNFNERVVRSNDS